MKIGILTFHRALNYGAALQCYALQEYLKMLGHEVMVIDYRQAFIEKTYKPFSVVKLFNIAFRLHFAKAMNYLRRYPARKSRAHKFRLFAQRYLNSTPPCTATQIPTDFDLYIHGSDQIWNEKLTGGIDKIFLGEYQVKTHAKKITYAASMELHSLNDRERAIFNLLENFEAISVREKELIQILQPFYSRGAIIPVVDPTMLAPPALWKPFIQNGNSVPAQHYVALYSVGPKSLAFRQAELVAKQLNAQIVQINVLDPDPAQFVALIHDAQCVVSDSFHATVFALLFRKNFYAAAVGTGSDVRLMNLLENLGLEERLINTCTDYEPVNYENIETRIERMRNDSASYLKAFLNDD